MFNIERYPSGYIKSIEFQFHFPKWFGSLVKLFRR